MEQGRRAVADLISADADEIVFTSGATEANNLAILGLLGHGGVARTRVVVSAIEHKCVLNHRVNFHASDTKLSLRPLFGPGISISKL